MNLNYLEAKSSHKGTFQTGSILSTCFHNMSLLRMGTYSQATQPLVLKNASPGLTLSFALCCGKDIFLR